MIEAVEQGVLALGLALISVGAFCDLAASIGMVRFPNFFVRLHAATVGSIGGAVIPLIGVALAASVSTQLGGLRWAVTGASATSALIIMLVAPTGSHALAYSAHKARVVPVSPKVVDRLEEHERLRRGEG